MMEKIIAGKRLHPIGIGTWGMGGTRLKDGAIFAEYDHDEREIAAVRYALEQGQNHIDTAQLYGAGHTEEIVGKAIAEHPRENIFLASKVWKSHAFRTAVPHAVEGMLRRLDTDYLDLLYVHAYFDAVPMEEYILGLNDVVDSGMTRHIAVSNFTLEQLKKALSLTRHPLVANQVHYNLLERRYAPAELLQFCRKENIAVVAYRPLERKRLADNNESETLREMAERYQVKVSQIALNWLLVQDNVIPITKASSAEHIDENLASLTFTLSEKDRKTLDTLTPTAY
jgi:diketogulonate reductase-like aldo/keto reductase